MSEELPPLKTYRIHATITLLVQAEDENSAEDAGYEAMVDNFGHEVARAAAYHDPEEVNE